MKTLSVLTIIALGAGAVFFPSSSSAQDAKGAIAFEETVEVESGYEGGRGLLTLQGPSGMFINPTSATLPGGAFTAQYCFFTPFNDSSVVGHGAFLSYGVTDYFELGAIGNIIAIDGGDDLDGAGPLARLRLFEDDGLMPQVSVGYYGRFGDVALERQTGFLAAYKRLPISDSGPVRSLGFHAGGRQTWFDSDDKLAGYFGAELQLPLRLYLVGEVTTRDRDFETDIPYAVGVQWRAGGVNISVAGIQDGNLDELGFFFGIGTALSF